MIKWESYQPGHFGLIKDPLPVFEDFPNIQERINSLYYKGESPILTLIADGRPIAILGLTPYMPKAGEVWTYLGSEVKKHPIAFHRTVEHLIEYFMNEQRIDRIHATVNAKYEKGLKWIKALGFEREGLMKKWNGKNDFYLYARVKDV